MHMCRRGATKSLRGIQTKVEGGNFPWGVHYAKENSKGQSVKIVGFWFLFSPVSLVESWCIEIYHKASPMFTQWF